MISLTATTVIKDLVTAVRIANSGEALHDLAGRGVPIDDLEGTVWLASQRRCYSVLTVLIVIQPRRLLTEIALRGWVILVPTDAHDLAIVFATGLNFDATVQLTEDACAGHPFFVRHG